MNNRKGLTLIEIIISIAIISIMAVTILGMFNISITNIFRFGQRTEQVLKTKKDIDDKIKTNEENTDGEDEIDIKIGSFETKVKGNLVESMDSDGNFDIKIKTFVPVKVSD